MRVGLIASALVCVFAAGCGGSGGGLQGAGPTPTGTPLTFAQEQTLVNNAGGLPVPMTLRKDSGLDRLDYPVGLLTLNPNGDSGAELGWFSTVTPVSFGCSGSPVYSGNNWAFALREGSVDGNGLFDSTHFGAVTADQMTSEADRVLAGKTDKAAGSFPSASLPTVSLIVPAATYSHVKAWAQKFHKTNIDMRPASAEVPATALASRSSATRQSSGVIPNLDGTTLAICWSPSTYAVGHITQAYKGVYLTLGHGLDNYGPRVLPAYRFFGIPQDDGSYGLGVVTTTSLGATTYDGVYHVMVDPSTTATTTPIKVTVTGKSPQSATSWAAQDNGSFYEYTAVDGELDQAALGLFGASTTLGAASFAMELTVTVNGTAMDLKGTASPSDVDGILRDAVTAWIDSEILTLESNNATVTGGFTGSITLTMTPQ